MPNNNNDGTDALSLVQKGFSFTFKINWKNMDSTAYSQCPQENTEYQVIANDPDKKGDKYNFSCYYIFDESRTELLRVFQGSCDSDDGYIGLVKAILETVHNYTDILYKNTIDIIKNHDV